MDTDDLPPEPQQRDSGFSGELGRTFAGAVGIGLFLVVAGVVLFFVIRWSGH
jgi:hypothetical protein